MATPDIVVATPLKIATYEHMVEKPAGKAPLAGTRYTKRITLPSSSSLEDNQKAGKSKTLERLNSLERPQKEVVYQFKMEKILNCEVLKGFFEENKRDLQALRHEKPSRTIKVHPHLAHVSEYILPRRPSQCQRNAPLMVSKVDYGKRRGEP
ncbi:GH18038 [Drosophila grimshawi]|uniref:GH18038 n=1 Tax=Drosophila grimshawi TaxID=7222 RepID=B4JHQ8_DROGR|nr:GH18038 [Drosophila grimshawi]